MDSSLPEAPITMFTNYKRADGFEVSLTVRGRVLRDVATELNNAIETIVKAGGTPVTRSNGFPKKPDVPTKPCPVHKTDMKEKTNKQGEKFFSHSKGVYPNLTYCNGTGWPGEVAYENA